MVSKRGDQRLTVFAGGDEGILIRLLVPIRLVARIREGKEAEPLVLLPVDDGADLQKARGLQMRRLVREGSSKFNRGRYLGVCAGT